MSQNYVGRFAPSPTGRLHIGSLLTATASFLDARAHKGIWRVRIEDLDPPREEIGAADAILRTLEAFSLGWDGEVVYQSRRHRLYQEALDELSLQGLIYACTCSRQKIRKEGHAGVDGFVYSGRCRNTTLPLSREKAHAACRIRVPDMSIGFDDAVVGHYAQNLARDIGDFVLFRADGCWAYQLAVVVDDADQGITHIVRGQDLLVCTPRQIYLSGCLKKTLPHYAHLPLLTNALGQKWSKQTRATPLDISRKEELMQQVLALLLGQTPPDDDCAAQLQWALSLWDMNRVPKSAIVTDDI